VSTCVQESEQGTLASEPRVAAGEVGTVRGQGGGGVYLHPYLLLS
jgi:hypothetical protein